MRLIDADKFKQQIAAIVIRDNLVTGKGNALCDLIDRQPTAYDADKVVERLDEYESLEEQGKLLKLPCVVGDTVYVLEADEKNFEQFHCSMKISELQFDYWMIPLFKKCVFLSREEAESALKRLCKIVE